MSSDLIERLRKDDDLRSRIEAAAEIERLTARKVVGPSRGQAKEALRRWHRDTCYPDALDGELDIGLDAIAALIAGPLPEGFAEAREAWEGVLAGMKRFGMESEAIETIDDYFASSKPTVRDRWQHVAYFDEGAFHWMSGIAPRDCELFARPTGES